MVKTKRFCHVFSTPLAVRRRCISYRGQLFLWLGFWPWMRESFCHWLMIRIWDATMGYCHDSWGLSWALLRYPILFSICSMYGILNNIYQHLPPRSPSFVGKHTSTMEHLGMGMIIIHALGIGICRSFAAISGTEALGEYHTKWLERQISKWFTVWLRHSCNTWAILTMRQVRSFSPWWTLIIQVSPKFYSATLSILAVASII